MCSLFWFFLFFNIRPNSGRDVSSHACTCTLYCPTAPWHTREREGREIKKQNLRLFSYLQSCRKLCSYSQEPLLRDTDTNTVTAANGSTQGSTWNICALETHCHRTPSLAVQLGGSWHWWRNWGTDISDNNLHNNIKYLNVRRKM